MLRLLTYNIHGCIGRAGHADPAAITEVIRASGADVVALQEVFDDGGPDGFLHQLGGLGFASVIHGRTMLTPRGHYGNVLMSRVEPGEIQHIDLGGVEPRAAIRFHLDLRGRPLDVCGTHLGLPSAERRRQVAQLDEVLADADERNDDVLQILMGDLNEWRPRTRFMRTVRQRFPWLSRNVTFPARRPVIALDRIAVRGNVRSVNFRRLDTPPADRASDHRPLLAEIELDPPPSGR